MSALRRLSLGVVTLTALLLAVLPATAYADTSGQGGSPTVTIDGHDYGPEDGLVINHYEIPITPGDGSVGMQFPEAPSGQPGMVVPYADWGASYAHSTETLQLHYTGKAYAAANVYGGKRIVQVCIWYTRGDNTVSDTACSTAISTSGTHWNPGSVATTSCWDSLNPFAPATIFNISTVRIDPTIFP